MEIINFEDAKGRKQGNGQILKINSNKKLQKSHLKQMIVYRNCRGNTESTPSFVTNGITTM
jgi:hypothetical protein